MNVIKTGKTLRTPEKPINPVMDTAPLELEGYASDSQTIKNTPKQSQTLDDRRVKRKLLDGRSSDLHSVMAKMHELFEKFELKQKKNIDVIVKSISVVQEQNSEIQASIEFLSTKYDQILERMTVLERENSDYKKQIEQLESRIEIFDRNSRSTMIELRNVPVQLPENKDTLRNIVKSLGQTLELPIVDTDIRDVIRSKPKQNRPGPVLVEFSTSHTRDNLMRKSRTFNKENRNIKLNTSHIKFPGPPQPIYVGESLTAKAKKLHYLGRQLVSEKIAYSCWSTYGNVYVKQKENSNPIKIVNLDDINKLRITTTK